jgi:hypothetical protein
MVLTVANFVPGEAAVALKEWHGRTYHSSKFRAFDGLPRFLKSLQNEDRRLQQPLSSQQPMSTYTLSYRRTFPHGPTIFSRQNSEQNHQTALLRTQQALRGLNYLCTRIEMLLVR